MCCTSALALAISSNMSGTMIFLSSTRPRALATPTMSPSCRAQRNTYTTCTHTDAHTRRNIHTHARTRKNKASPALMSRPYDEEMEMVSGQSKATDHSGGGSSDNGAFFVLRVKIRMSRSYFHHLTLTSYHSLSHLCCLDEFLDRGGLVLHVLGLLQ